MQTTLLRALVLPLVPLLAGVLALRLPQDPAGDRAAALPGAERLSWQPTVLAELAVSDLERSIAFYRDTLELELLERVEGLAWASFATPVPGLTIGLGEREDPEGSGTTSINLAVGDLDAARALLEARGVVFDGPTVRIPGIVRLADFRDPDGNRLRLAGHEGG